MPIGGGYTRRADGIILAPDGKPCRQCNSLRDLMRFGGRSSGNSDNSSVSKSPSADGGTASFFSAFGGSGGKKKDNSDSSSTTSGSGSSSSSQSTAANSIASLGASITGALGVGESAASSGDSDGGAKAPFDPTSCPPDVEQLGRSSWTLLHSVAAGYPARATAVEQKDMSDFIRTFAQFYPCGACAQDLRAWMAIAGNAPVLDRGWAGLGQWMCRAHNEVNVKLGKEPFDCKLWRQRWKDGWKDGRCGP